jgi:16S rRNA (guanine527-N7)-methyltransferase
MQEFDVDACPPPPEAAAATFGDALGKAREFAGLLASHGVSRGLLGPREAARLWDRHLMNCAVVADLVPPSGELVDIGSGAGLPGVVLAMLRPEVRVVLLEPMLRRARFLSECAESLELANVTVVRARAEEVAMSADIATARAVAPLGRLVGWAAGVVRPGGTILAIKGQGAEEELKAAEPALRRLGVQSTEVLRVGHGRVVPATTVVRVVTRARGREEQLGAHGSRSGVA